MIVSLVTYVIFIMALVIVLAVFNIQLYPLILSVGVISAVVVLGSQLLISNLLGGTVVYVEKPFLKGDLIRVGDNMGIVQGVSIRATTLKGLNGLNITIPNSTFLTTPITNYTRTKQYLIKVPFTMPRESISPASSMPSGSMPPPCRDSRRSAASSSTKWASARTISSTSCISG